MGVIVVIMPITVNKQRVLTHLFSSLKKRYEPGEPEDRPVLEQLIYAICREGATRELADQAYQALRERFFDWNEIRVSSSREVEEVLAELTHAEARAQRIIGLLQEVFETTFSFDLESLHKKGLKQAAKQIERYQSANDYTSSWAVQRSLGGHAIPVDPPTLRATRRLGLVDEDQENLEALRGTLEHLVPKAKGPLFNELISFLAEEYCWDDDPNCSACPMCGDCVYGKEASRTVTSRPKPK